MEEIIKSQDYLSFRSSVPQKKICVASDKEWVVYDAGPKTVRSPIIFLPPASGTADIFFRQILSLSSLGYRVISVDYPVFWTVREWCDGFRKLLDALQLDQVHLYGASLGGFLAQKFAESTHKNQRVASLLLCNAFVDTAVFQQTTSAHSFWLVPAVLLKKMVMGNFERGLVDEEIADSVDFMVEKLDGLNQAQLASRLTLNCMSAYVEPQKICDVPITLIDVYDKSALSQTVREETYKCYPEAKRAHLKSGGNFPYLSRADEVNVHVRIHVKPFENTRQSPVVAL